MELIEKALQIALKAHAGQKDKGGESYVLHPLRVMAKMTNENAKITAILHDAMEDGELTERQLADAGFSETVISAIRTLTRNDGEEYEAYIERITLNPIAVEVKIADIEDNINILRLNAISAGDMERLVRYHTAWRRLRILPGPRT